VWPLFVVFRVPAFDDKPRFSNRHEDPAVQATIAKDTVERFVVTVLPRASGRDEVRAGGSVLDSLLDASRYELWAVVTLDDRGVSTTFHRLVEHTNHVV
jgi:hypothetical protein